MFVTDSTSTVTRCDETVPAEATSVEAARPWPHGSLVWTEPPPAALEPPFELPVVADPTTGGLAVVAVRPLPGRHRKVVQPTVWSRFRVWADQVWAALAEDPTR